MGRPFSAAWEVLHGPARAFGEVVKLQGARDGTQSGQCTVDDAIAPQESRNDSAARLLCISVDERSGRFVSDQVGVSQTFASLLLHVPHCSVLQPFVVEPNHIQDVRYAGLLGVKYEVVVRNDLVKDYAPSGRQVPQGVVQGALPGLNNAADDIRSVASLACDWERAISTNTYQKSRAVMPALRGCMAGVTDDSSSTVGRCHGTLANSLHKRSAIFWQTPHRDCCRP